MKTGVDRKKEMKKKKENLKLLFELFKNKRQSIAS